MFEYFINFISIFTKSPFILSILKQTLMGHKVSKTLDYYRNKKVCSVFEEEIEIAYKFMGNHFILKCNSFSYKKAIEYIKKNPNPFYEKDILLACELLDNGEFRDITAKVLKLAGPDCDFYKGTEFSLISCDITEYPLYIIKDNFIVYRFQKEDNLDFNSAETIDIKIFFSKE